MELVFITHGNILNLHVLSPLISWLVVGGALYGALRLVIDVVQLFRRGSHKHVARHPSVAPAYPPRPEDKAGPSALT